MQTHFSSLIDYRSSNIGVVLIGAVSIGIGSPIILPSTACGSAAVAESPPGGVTTINGPAIMFGDDITVAVD